MVGEEDSIPTRFFSDHSSLNQPGHLNASLPVRKDEAVSQVFALMRFEPSRT